jgi:uncharacterized protein YuzE
MKFKYYSETDSLYIDLSEKNSVESVEAASEIVLDLDAEGNLVGIDIDHASHFINLGQLEVEALPLRSFAFSHA